MKPPNLSSPSQQPPPQGGSRTNHSEKWATSEIVRQHGSVPQARMRRALARRLEGGSLGPSRCADRGAWRGSPSLCCSVRSSWALLEPEEARSSQEQGSPLGKTRSGYVLRTEPSTSPEPTDRGQKIHTKDTQKTHALNNGTTSSALMGI